MHDNHMKTVSSSLQTLQIALRKPSSRERTPKSSSHLHVKKLVVEEANSGEGHGNAVLVAGLNDVFVLNGTSWLSDV